MRSGGSGEASDRDQRGERHELEPTLAALAPRRITITAVIALLFSCLPQFARADGDPASDVLAEQPLFLAQDAGVPARQQAQLGALLAVAAREGYQLRVAVISSRADLGSVTDLWGQPQLYARFIGQELSLAYRGPLLVVMPSGYGLVGARRSTLAGLRPPGTALGTAALAAIQRLAAASGRALPVPSASAPGHAGSATVSWLVFVVGLVAVVAAWTASLRARPLRGARM